jgi:colicin import membrane protein
MKKLLLCFFVGFCSLASAADVAVQPPAVAASQAASGFPSEAERNQESQRLTRQREALENQYTQDIRQCYQKFDVNRCRLEARDRRIEANSALRKEELRFNAMERQIHTEEARRNLAERNSEAKEKEAQAKRAAAIQASKDRADANAQKQIEHELQGTKRGEFEQKQRDAAQHRADIEKKQRERNQEPAAPLPVPGQ